VHDTASAEEAPVNEESVFKVCSCCGHIWQTREDFLDDRELEAIGYQVDFRHLHLGLFYFNHSTCRTTLTAPAGAFTDLYDGRVFEERMTGTADCPSYCLHESELSACPAACECAFIREVLQLIRRRMGGGATDSSDLPVNF
jgi:hypothetical protein